MEKKKEIFQADLKRANVVPNRIEAATIICA